MRMHWNTVTGKCHNWRIKRVLSVKLKTQLEIFPFEKGFFGTSHINLPTGIKKDQLIKIHQ